jgi:hypothetical protein
VNGVPNGIIGFNPRLDDLTNGNLKMQYDFRSVYASILRQWFGVGESDLRTILLRDFQTLPVIKSVPTSVDSSFGLPSEYQLYQNYPNPFNPSTTISFDLPSETSVQLKVYDMMGRDVATLVNGRLHAGHHRVQFDASSGFASGAYVYYLKAGSFSDRKRMLFVK